MTKVITLFLGLTLTAMVYAAELIQPYNNSCDPIQKAENCILNNCEWNSSAISEDPDCQQECRECAKESCELYNTPSEKCQNITL